MKIWQHQGYNDIEVVIATKWCHYLFYLQPYSSALGTVLPKRFTGTFSSNGRLDFHEVWVKSVRALSRYFAFGMKFLWTGHFIIATGSGDWGGKVEDLGLNKVKFSRSPLWLLLYRSDPPNNIWWLSCSPPNVFIFQANLSGPQSESFNFTLVSIF